MQKQLVEPSVVLATIISSYSNCFPVLGLALGRMNIDMKAYEYIRRFVPALTNDVLAVCLSCAAEWPIKWVTARIRLRLRMDA